MYRVAVAFALISLALPAAAGERPFDTCRRGADHCVIDGDTFRLGGEVIRIENIDAPETHRAKCDAERRLGALAAKRLATLLTGANVSLVPVGKRDVDRHGRKLRLVLVDGQDAGEALISEGLARPWTGKRRPWCG